MSTVGVTGARGMLGWHTACALSEDPDVCVTLADRSTFRDARSLASFVSRCDAIVHCAGMNRGPDDEVESTNVDLAEVLVEALRSSDSRAHVVYANSIQSEGDSAYGRGKRTAAETIGAWAVDAGTSFTNVIIPNVFGEGGRPFYNSVVATFCHQLATGDEPTIIEDRELELVHAQDVAGAFRDALSGAGGGTRRLTGARMRVSEVLGRLRDIVDEYRDGYIPDLRPPLARPLFNTFRSFLFPARLAFALPEREDPRGRLVESVKTPTGGQVFFSSTNPGHTRGNHFHLRKVERFVVVAGAAEIRFRRVFGDEVVSVAVDGRDPVFVDIPTLHTHSITNVGADPLLTLFWADEIFDPAHPDTIADPVDA